jgi:hypothetical protein
MSFENSDQNNKVSDISEGHRIRIEEELKGLQNSNFPEVKEAIAVSERILGGEAVQDHTVENILLVLRSKLLLGKDLQDREMYRKGIEVLEKTRAYIQGEVDKNKIRGVIQGYSVEGDVIQLNDFRKEQAQARTYVGVLTTIVSNLEQRLQELNKELDDADTEHKEREKLEQDIQETRAEFLRLSLIVGEYSPEKYESEIVRVVNIFKHAGNIKRRQAANQQMKVLSEGLMNVIPVFKKYGLQEDADRARELQQKIIDGFHDASL